MRPRKRIRLLDEDEDRRSITAYMLTVSGFAIIENFERCDLVIATWPGHGKEIEQAVGIPILALSKKVDQGVFEIPANRHLVGAECQPFQIIAAAREMSKRKRGPAKGSHPQRTQRQLISA